MLQNANNAYAKAITDKAGMLGLNQTATSLGMSQTKVNHHVGCPSIISPNSSSLVDLGKIDVEVARTKSHLGIAQQYHYYKHLLATFYGSGAMFAGGRLTPVIDSEAASTTTDLQPYLPMLRSIAGMYRRYLPPNPTADRFASFVESLDEAAWNRLLEHIPEAITSREPVDFGDWDGVSVQALTEAAAAG